MGNCTVPLQAVKHKKPSDPTILFPKEWEAGMCIHQCILTQVHWVHGAIIHISQEIGMVRMVQMSIDYISIDRILFILLEMNFWCTTPHE